MIEHPTGNNIINLENVGWTKMIIKCKSGFYYTSDTQGKDCIYPKIQGAMVPIPSAYDIGKILDRNIDFTRRLDLDNLEHLIRLVLSTSATGYKIQLDKYQPQHQGWIHVVCKKMPGVVGEIVSFSNLSIDTFEAVLTYENSF